MLAANKKDLIDQRTVSTEEGKLLAEKNHMFYYETSSKDN